MEDAGGHGSEPNQSFGEQLTQATHQRGVGQTGKFPGWLGDHVRAFMKSESGAGRPIGADRIQSALQKVHNDPIGAAQTAAGLASGDVGALVHLAHFLGVMATLAICTIVIQHFIA
jgi:hypothetical protein